MIIHRSLGTCLHGAACYNYHEIAEVLIGKMESLVYAQDLSGRTPLHMAAEGKNLETVALLLKHNADVNSKDKQGDTPLHYAMQGETPTQMVKLLLEHKPQINALNLKGLTAMDCAILSGQFAHAQLLANTGGIFRSDHTVEFLSNEAPHYQSLLYHGPNAIRIDNLAGASLFGSMSSRALNIGTSTTKDVQTEVKFEAIAMQIISPCAQLTRSTFTPSGSS